MVFALGLLGACSASGCCISSRLAEQMRNELATNNLERSEPRMRAAATAVGAELLPFVVQWNWRLERCDTRGLAPGAPCMTWESEDGRAFRTVGAGGVKLIGVRVHGEGFRYARLARRARTLVLFEPVVVRRRLGQETVCECQGFAGHDPLVASIQAGHEAVILLPELELERIEVHRVAITQDFIHWRCAVTVTAA